MKTIHCSHRPWPKLWCGALAAGTGILALGLTFRRLEDAPPLPPRPLRLAVIPSLENLPVLLLADRENARPDLFPIELIRVKSDQEGRRLLAQNRVDVFVGSMEPLVAGTGSTACNGCGGMDSPRSGGEDPCLVRRRGPPTPFAQRRAGGYDPRGRDAICLVAWRKNSRLDPVHSSSAPPEPSITGTGVGEDARHVGSHRALLHGRYGVFAVRRSFLRDRPDAIAALSELISRSHDAIFAGRSTWRQRMLREGLWRDDGFPARPGMGNEISGAPRCRTISPRTWGETRVTRGA